MFLFVVSLMLFVVAVFLLFRYHCSYYFVDVLVVQFVFLLVFVQVDFFLRKIFLWLYGCLYLFFLVVCLFDCRIVLVNIFQTYNCVLECG